MLHHRLFITILLLSLWLTKVSAGNTDTSLISSIGSDASSALPSDSLLASSSTLVSHDVSIRGEQFILPGAMIAIGAWGLADGWMKDLNHEVNKRMYDLNKRDRTHIDDWLRFIPLGTHLGLDHLGVPAKHTFRERMMTTITATVTMGVLTQGLKWSIHERRPDGSDRESFPSGHTACAFMGAELTRIEYGTISGIGAYTIASATALLRLYNHKHWLGDVVAGAGIGILSAQIAHLILPWERKLLGMERKETSFVFLPSYDPNTQTKGISLGLTF